MSTPATPVGTDGSVQQWTKAGPVAGPLPVPDLERLQETQEATVADVVLSIGLFCFAYISLLFAAAAVKLNAVFVMLLAALVPGFALSGLGLLGEPAVIGHIGGYFLLLSALIAFYAASAEVMNAVYGRSVLPLLGRA